MNFTYTFQNISVNHENFIILFILKHLKGLQYLFLK